MTDYTSTINELAQSACASHQLPGLAIAIARDGKPFFANGYGHCDGNGLQAVTADSLFGVASVTKIVTAIAVLLLHQRGELSIDDPLGKYYPTLQLACIQEITIAHLLCHAAGWPGMASRFQALNQTQPLDRSGGNNSDHRGCFDDNELLADVDSLVAFINRQPPQSIATPGKLLNYSNEGFCLLGGVVETITGMPWRQFVSQQIFIPLRLQQTVIGTPQNCRHHLAQPLVNANSGHWQNAGIWDAPLFYPAGGMLSSVQDLVALLNVLHDDGPLLQPTTRALLLDRRMSVRSRSEISFGYSAGLEYRRFDDGRVMHWHTGQRAGVSSFVAAVPSLHLSIAVLSNCSDAPLTAIGHQCLNACTDLPNCQWPATVVQPASQTPQPNLNGEYGNAEGFHYRVKKNADSYRLINGSATHAMHFTSPHSGYVDQQSFTFLTKADSPPWALAIDLRILPRLPSPATNCATN